MEYTKSLKPIQLNSIQYRNIRTKRTLPIEMLVPIGFVTKLLENWCKLVLI